MLKNMQSLPLFLKQNFDFLLVEVEELHSFVVSIINKDAISTHLPCTDCGCPLQLIPEQPLLNLIFYMKYDDVNIYDSLH